MKGIKRCKRCGGKITIEEKAVLLKTFRGNETLEQVFWHWQCYLDWRDESLEIRAKKIYNNTMKAIVPQFKEMLGNFNNEEETKENNLLSVRVS